MSNVQSMKRLILPSLLSLILQASTSGKVKSCPYPVPYVTSLSLLPSLVSVQRPSSCTFVSFIASLPLPKPATVQSHLPSRSLPLSSVRHAAKIHIHKRPCYKSRILGRWRLNGRQRDPA